MEVSFSDSFKKVFRKRVKSTEIEREYRIRSQKEFRAIAGLSMGGNQGKRILIC